MYTCMIQIHQNVSLIHLYHYYFINNLKYLKNLTNDKLEWFINKIVWFQGIL